MGGLTLRRTHSSIEGPVSRGKTHHRGASVCVGGGGLTLRRTLGVKELCREGGLTSEEEDHS